MDFEEIKGQLRDEIDSATKIWTEVLIEFQGDNLAYIYSKGSAMKPWDTWIDYVPLISDLDIHYGVYDLEKAFKSENPRKRSLEVSYKFEQRYIEENADRIHIPRSQIMCTNDLKTKVQLVHPLESSVKMLNGEFPTVDYLTDEQIKIIDFDRLEELKPYLDRLPDAYVDKIGLDYWASLRNLNWKVSPSPVRVLSHLLPDPLKIWTWNRTKIVQRLEELDLETIAHFYIEYYRSAWKLFNSGLASTKYYQLCLLNGSQLLEECYNWSQKYKANNIMQQ